MKLKHTIALSAAMIASASAFAGETYESLHPGGYAIQIGPGWVAPAYYAKNNQYTVGLEVGTQQFVDNTDGSEYNNTSLGPFARYNFRLTKNTTIGPGLQYVQYYGNVDTRTYEYVVSQYVSLEYAGSPNILIGASLQPINYYQFNRDATSATKNYQISVLNGGSLQITYVF